MNLATGAVGPPLLGLSGGYIASIAVDGDRLIVGDRGSFEDPNAAGLKIYDARTAALVAGPISTGLPPNNIVVLGPQMIPTAVADANAEALPAQFGLANPYPNPFNASVLISYRVDSDYAHGELTVLDMLGRTVRTLVFGELGRGQHAQQWDGRDDAGHIAGNGSYLVQLRVGDQQT
ncbi:MAG: FlgD immunoglobulin-like domain containing protein, partial [Candidatus Latescibacterota bacterium]